MYKLQASAFKPTFFSLAAPTTFCGADSQSAMPGLFPALVSPNLPCLQGRRPSFWVAAPLLCGAAWRAVADWQSAHCRACRRASAVANRRAGWEPALLKTGKKRVSLNLHLFVLPKRWQSAPSPFCAFPESFADCPVGAFRLHDSFISLTSSCECNLAATSLVAGVVATIGLSPSLSCRRSPIPPKRFPVLDCSRPRRVLSDIVPVCSVPFSLYRKGISSG
jgi:hypothetical protein